MAVISKYKLTKILTALVWILLGSGTIILLVAAITKRNNEHCLQTNINISGVQSNFFIDKKDVIAIIQKTNGGKLENKSIQDIDLASMEIALQKDQWIKKAELFLDNNNVLQVRISEREPIARIFTSSGASFYMDSSLKRLPLSDKFSARLPVFTNFPTDVVVLTKKDSNLLRQIKMLGEFIGKSPFWMAQIEQVDINEASTFELTPKIGNQIIYFGNAGDYREKFGKLLTFYRQIEAIAGWNKYSAIDLKYKGQVIGIRRGAQEIKMDSLKAVQIMKIIIANAQKHTNDSTNIQLVQPPDDNGSVNETPVIENVPTEEVYTEKKIKSKVIQSTSAKNKKPETKKNAGNLKVVSAEPSSFKKPGPVPLKKKIIEPGDSKTPQTLKAKPKAVMPPKNDY
ncbi:MAG TPA: hypothetical protein VGP55_16755 [Chitinophagaceae bacterium]|nr:hypothetical protein [Chitinophagaceae bacterium]